MSFVLSKILWILLQPSNLLLLALALAVLAGWRRLALGLVAVLALVVVLPVGLWLVAPLEARYPQPSAMPDEVSGIIVLGGAQDPVITAHHGRLAVNDAAERLIEGLALAYRYPEARLVFSGGTAALFPAETIERDVNEIFVALMALDRDRVVYEDRSRNTWENALFTRELVTPEPGETWLLVTSAAHMPRSMGIFERIGWTVLPWPVDYRAAGRPITHFDAGMRLVELDRAMREWLGLLAYRLMDRTDRLLPGA